MATTFTVLQVAEHIDRQVRDVWSSQFWVRGEVAGLKRTARGQVYFDLVQTGDGGGVLAQLSVSMPPSKSRLVERRLRAVGQPLDNGLEVRIKATLSFWVRAGRLTLALSDIDPAHTAGALAVARRALLEAMAADGSRWANAALPRPRLPLSLGLVTSAGSQAFHDLTDELAAGGHPFRVVLVPTLVQGPEAPGQVAAAIRALDRRGGVDLVLLTRGGGAEVDLLTFDHPEVARAIAGCRVPVWTGIGHHLDSPVAEQVAAAGFKTPTALGQAVVAAVDEAADAVEGSWQAIRDGARRRLAAADRDLAMAARRTSSARVVLRTAAGRLSTGEHRVTVATARALAVRREDLRACEGRLTRAADAATGGAARRLDRVARLVDLADPQRLLARGWSLTTDADGALVTGPVPAGTRLETRTRGGRIHSVATTSPDADPETAETGDDARG